MDWLLLAHDIASRVEQEEREELACEVAELADAERATLSLEDRLRGALHTRVDLGVHGIGAVAGRVEAVGQGWCLLSEGENEHLITIGAIRFLRPAGVAQQEGGLPVSLASILRHMQGQSVTLWCGEEIRGQIVGVGRDHIVVDEVGYGFGSHAAHWQPHYDFGKKSRPAQVVIAMSALSMVSAARVNRSI